MARFRFSGVPVIEPDGRLIGIITNRDIRFMEPGDELRPVTDFMTSEGPRHGVDRYHARPSQGPAAPPPHREGCRWSTRVAISPGSSP